MRKSESCGLVTASLIFAIAGLCGCASNNEPNAVPTAQTTTTATPNQPSTSAVTTTTTVVTTTTTSAPSATPQDQPATTAPTAAAPARAGIGEGEQPGVHVEIKELKRSSDTIMKLKYLVVNDSEQPLPVASGYLADRARNALGNEKDTASGPCLLDESGKQKFVIMRDSDDKPLCSVDVTDIGPKSRSELWADYPAAPFSVSKVTVIIPHFQPINDVAITQ
jgi:hypothetical protein